jgi:glycosyltransferase involved in cell wall biosynthesis
MTSVIIPCFNAGAFLNQTLDSVFRQQGEMSEVICVDDGSTDNTLAVMEQYPVKVLRHAGGGNSGVSASRNLGLAHATGEFVSFLDADDIWEPTFLSRTRQVMQDDNEIGVVYTHCVAIDEHNKKLFEFPKRRPSQPLAHRLLLDCFIQTPSIALIRRQALDRVGGFEPAILTAEDHDLWIRLAEITGFAFIDEPLAYYRKHSSQWSNRGARQMWESGLRVVERACARADYGRTARWRRAVLYYRLGQCDWRDGAYHRAARRWIMAGLLDPGRVMRKR